MNDASDQKLIDLAVIPRVLSITSGEPTNVQVTLTNRGTSVDWFTITVEGVPPEWIQGTEDAVQLQPGTHETINLPVNVTRKPSNKAQNYAILIQARSHTRQEQFKQIKAIWIVEPFRDISMYLEPRWANGYGTATYYVMLQNRGNVAAPCSLSGNDDRQNLHYQFAFNFFDLDGGYETCIPLTVSTHRRLVGYTNRIPFQLQTAPTENLPSQKITGEFVDKAFLPLWLLPTIGSIALIIVLLISSLFSSILPFLRQATSITQTVQSTGQPAQSTTTIQPTIATTTIQSTPAQPTAAPTQPPLTPEQQAEAVLTNYYNAINNQDYMTAYNLWPDYQGTYQDFASGFSNTSHDSYTINSVSQQPDGTIQINITLTAISTSSQESLYQGYYIVGLQSDNSWKIVEGNFQQI